MKYTKFITPIIIIIALVFSCEKDDICAEETQTTPQLVIRFYDVNDTDETQTVLGLLAYGLDDMNIPFGFQNEGVSTRDSIAIPLPLDTNTFSFVLHEDYEVDDNDTPDDTTDDTVLGNPDTITVTYEPEDVFVSRACGFKTVYNNITFTVTPDAENWIANSEIVINNVENQNAAHVQVFH